MAPSTRKTARSEPEPTKEVIEDQPSSAEDGEGEDDEDVPEVAAETADSVGEGNDAAARLKKLSALRARMRDSARANREALLDETTKARVSARDAARREKQLRLAETLRAQADAEERGEDIERSKNWEWTIEENDEWEKKKRRKARGADFEFHDEEHQARRRYKKDLGHIKPDLVAYNKQKALALGVTPESIKAGSSSSAITSFDPTSSSVVSYEQRQAAESLYRDANSLLYADNKPDEEAIDRVIHKLNIDQDKRNKFSRKRLNEDEGDITYINERNRVFNKKIARFYDKYTSEIRASFERGTAL